MCIIVDYLIFYFFTALLASSHTNLSAIELQSSIDALAGAIQPGSAEGAIIRAKVWLENNIDLFII